MDKTTVMAIIITTGTAMNDAATSRDILRLAAWLSLPFPLVPHIFVRTGIRRRTRARGGRTDARAVGYRRSDGLGRTDGGSFVLAHRAASTSGFETLDEILAVGCDACDVGTGP